VSLFPNLADTKEAAARGNKEAIKALPEMRSTVAHARARLKRFERDKIRDIDHVPEVDDW
jgi:hypothetical protein